MNIYITFIKPFMVVYEIGRSEYEEVVKKEFSKLMFNKYKFNCIKVI